MRYRATLAYDGTAYQGFQRQAGETPTIQLTVERAIRRVSEQVVTVSGAGRTDTGVHASGQVIAFDVEWRHSDEALLRAINANLPDDVALQDIRQQPGFRPRFDARSRLYRYRILVTAVRRPLERYRYWQINYSLDEDLLGQSAGLLTGERDFGAFGKPPRGDNTVRTVYQSIWSRTEADVGVVWTYTVEANAFLQHMVRRMVWMQVKVGQGRMGVEAFEETFRRAQLADLRSIAPAHGLTLEAVRYNE